MIRISRRRGAAGMQYAMVVGLIGVVVLVALSSLGGTLNVMLRRTGNVLQDTVNGTSPAVTGGGTQQQTTIGIKLNGNGRSFTDNSYATSCQGYLSPGPGYSYTGETGNAVYTIKPGATAFDVTCNMTQSGGGWTRIGIFNGSTAPTILTLAERTSIAYTDVLLTDESNAIVKTVVCHATAQTGFAANSAPGYNCTASGMTTTSIRVLQTGTGSGGNFGIYQNNLGVSGGCSWGAATIWGRHYFDGSGTDCTSKGTGETSTSAAAWNTSFYTMWVR